VSGAKLSETAEQPMLNIEAIRVTHRWAAERVRRAIGRVRGREAFHTLINRGNGVSRRLWAFWWRWRWVIRVDQRRMFEQTRRVSIRLCRCRE
jgi:hypothetical protein